MQPSVTDAAALLSRTPGTLRELLQGVSEPLATGNEGSETWSPFDIVAHLIHADHVNWIPRLTHILNEGEGHPFEPFDRSGHVELARGKTLDALLTTFAEVRAESVNRLLDLGLTKADFARTGTHPTFGRVTLAQQLTTWVVHDLSHLAQIARVMAKQMKTEIGPWTAFIPIVTTGP